MKRLLCYAHFNEDNALSGFVRHSILSMQNICSEILFVSNSPLSTSDKQFLESCCSRVFVNDNSGYDFFMWKIALESVNYSDYDEIVLMNSSIFGPITPLKPAFESMNSSECDFWGITESFLIKPHLQSYFLVFKKRVIESEAFVLFWRSVLPLKNKNQVILNYEVGLSQWLVESGFIPEGYCSFEKLSSYFNSLGRRLKLMGSSSVKHAVELLAIGNPFLKVEPIKNNEIPLSAIMTHLADNNYPTEYIEATRKILHEHCPLCRSHAQLQYKNQKDRLNQFNDIRSNIYKCSNPTCGVHWVQQRPNKEMIHVIYHNHHKDAGTSELRAPIFGAESQSCKNDKKSSNNNKMGSPSKRRMLYIGNTLERYSALANDFDLEITEHHFFQSGSMNSNAVNENLDSLGLKREIFDIIFIPYIIEHCYDVESFLRSCMQYLKPGGAIYLITPNTGSFGHRVFRKYWYGLDIPRHITLFNQKALKTLLLSCGFEKIETSTTTLNANKYLMRSFDIMLDKFVTMNSESILVRRILVATLLTIGNIFNFVTKNHGEECLAKALRPKVNSEKDN